jgi:hypothetical protein
VDKTESNAGVRLTDEQAAPPILFWSMVAAGLLVSPFVFCAWCAAIAKFMNYLDKWAGPRP